MFRASKLYQSVSTSGPSATVNPRPTKTSSSRSHAWVTGWLWPRRGAARNSVRSSRSAAMRASSAAAASARRRSSSAAVTASVASLSARPAALRSSSVGHAAERALQHGQRAALAEQVLVEADDVVERGGRGDQLERRVPGGADVVDHESLFRGVDAGVNRGPRMSSKRGACAVVVTVPGVTRGGEIACWRAISRLPTLSAAPDRRAHSVAPGRSSGSQPTIVARARTSASKSLADGRRDRRRSRIAASRRDGGPAQSPADPGSSAPPRSFVDRAGGDVGVERRAVDVDGAVAQQVTEALLQSGVLGQFVVA